MAIVTGDRYLESLVKFVENNAEPLIEGTLVLKLNPVGLRYVHSRLEALAELESLIAGAPVDYLRAYVSDLGDHRALEQLRRILRLLPSLKVVARVPPPVRDPTPLSLLPFARLKVLELRGCDLSTSAAQGLLELRHTLEKLICHNSTDALRHVFVSRIAEIKDSPLWNRLSFVSCACNSLILMDESLQLLPAVETLDLSRNKFAKVDNLRKCTKLKHLDLGFNQLRTISSFTEVSSHIVKLVLRNNALTTLRGIENLKSLEELDLSYNVMSSFSEIEILVGLPSLQSLWLEGNPLCTARWYRAHVFSFFPYPDTLKLDERKISTREFWKVQIIVASRQKRPASFGFYSPAKDDAEFAEILNEKRKKISRLANIESQEQSTSIISDRDSVSCDNESQNKEENVNSDEEVEVVDLMKRIEYMKRERSTLWLKELREWINSESCVNGDEYSETNTHSGKQNKLRSKMRSERLGDTSRNISGSHQAPGDESSMNHLGSDTTFADRSVGFSTQQYFHRVGEAASKFFLGHSGSDSLPVTKHMSQNQEHHKSLNPRKSQSDSVVVPSGNKMNEKNIITPLTTFKDVIESQSSSARPGSPPHYQENILHRRHNLEEEFLQLSAESLSMVSSDSDTSCSNDDSSGFAQSVPDIDQYLIDKYSGRDHDCASSHRSKVAYTENGSSLQENGAFLPLTCAERDLVKVEVRGSESFSCLRSNESSETCCGGETVGSMKQDVWLEKTKQRKRSKRRNVLLKENHGFDQMEPLYKSNGDIDLQDEVKDEGPQPYPDSDEFRSDAEESSWANQRKSLHKKSGDFIQCHFNSNIADAEVNESCRQYMRCSSLIQDKSGCQEREVALIRSSEQKLYILLIARTCDGSGTSLQQIGCHRIDYVKEVVVGLGLQIVRVCIEGDVAYVFITRSTDVARQLVCMLDYCESHRVKDNFYVRSLEQVQVDLFERHVCGGSKMSIFQYSMVSFWRINSEEELWLPRSLFMVEGHLLVCIEDVMEFGPLSEQSSSSSYFSLDWCCSVTDVTEMVVENAENLCVTLSLKCDALVFRPSEQQVAVHDAALKKMKSSSPPITWKLKWFTEESFHNFIALLKAIFAGMTSSPLRVHRSYQ